MPEGASPPSWPGVKHAFVQAGHLRVHVAEAGDRDAPPIVLLHGWPQHFWCWRHVAPLLAGEHRVLMPDLRGHGWTDAPPGAYDKEQFATDLLALLDTLELDRVRLVGHDWGGWAGFLACLRAPKRFSGYLALNTGHPWPPQGSATLVHAWRFWYAALMASPIAGPALLQHAPDLMRRGLRDATVQPGVFSEDDLDIYVERLALPDHARATQHVYRTFLTRELPAVMRGRYAGQRLRVPGQMLYGTGDTVVRPSMLEGLADHADDFVVEHADGAGHFIAEELPALVADRALALP